MVGQEEEILWKGRKKKEYGRTGIGNNNVKVELRQENGRLGIVKDVRLGKLFKKCTHLL